MSDKCPKCGAQLEWGNATHGHCGACGTEIGLVVELRRQLAHAKARLVELKAALEEHDRESNMLYEDTRDRLRNAKAAKVKP